MDTREQPKATNIWRSALVAMMDALDTPACLIRQNGMIVHANNAASELCGPCRDNNGDPQHLALMFDEAAIGVIAHSHRLQAINEVIDVPFKDGVQRTSRLTVMPSGEALLCLSATADHLLRDSAMQSVADIIDQVAHNMNDLLTSALAHADEIYLALPVEETANEHLGALLLSAERAQMTLRELTSLTATTDSTWTTIDVCKRVIELQTLFSCVARQCAAVVVSTSRAPCFVRMSATDLDRTLVHLVSHAARATQAGDTVTVSVRATQSHVRIEVTPGVPQESGLSGWQNATSACRSVVESYNGAALYDANSKGITLTIPEMSTGLDADKAAPPIHGAERVLLIDDDNSVRKGLAFGLRVLGYEVTTAATAEHGVSLLQQQPPPDVLVCDLVLPGMNGLALSIYARQLHPNLPVVMTSGYSRYAAHLQHESIDLGLRFIAKPFGPPELALQIRALLARNNSDVNQSQS